MKNTKIQEFKHERSTFLMLCVTATTLAAAVLFYLNGLICGTAMGPYATDKDVISFLQNVEFATVVLHGFQSICTLIAGVLFINWLIRIIKNAQILNSEAKIQARSALVNTLVPLFNLIAPPIFISKIWKESTRNLKSPVWLLSCWWLTWLGTCFLRWYSTVWYNFAQAHDELSLAQKLSAYSLDNLGQLLSFLAAFSFLVLVSKTNRMQSSERISQMKESSEIQSDLFVKAMRLGVGLGQAAYIFIGIVAVLMSVNFAFKTFGGWGCFIALLVGPLSAVVIPWYAALAKGDWSLVLICYGGGIAYGIYSYIGKIILVWITNNDKLN